MILISIIGYLGLTLILIGYLLILFKKINVESSTYLVLNLTGSILLSYYSYKINSIPLFILQVVWAIGSLIKLILINIKNKKVRTLEK